MKMTKFPLTSLPYFSIYTGIFQPHFIQQGLCKPPNLFFRYQQTIIDIALCNLSSVQKLVPFPRYFTALNINGFVYSKKQIVWFTACGTVWVMQPCVSLEYPTLKFVIAFWIPGSPEGFLVIALVRPSVGRWSMVPLYISQRPFIGFFQFA